MTPRPTFTLRRLNAALLMALAGTAGAQTLSEVVVTANREAQQSFDAPAAIQGIGRKPSTASRASRC